MSEIEASKSPARPNQLSPTLAANTNGAAIENAQDASARDIPADENLTKEQKIERIGALLEEGKNLYKLSQFEDAAAKLGQAAAFSEEVHSHISPESGDVFFWYGKTLLKTAIQSAGLFDGKVVKKKSGEGAADDSGDGEAEDDDDDDDDDDDISTGEEGDDFTLAWEVLEIARTVYEKDASPDGKARLAQVFMLQGEVGLEDDNPPQSVQSFHSALSLKKSYLPPTHRELVEVHHLLGLALETDGKVEAAVEQFRMAKKVLEGRREEILAERAAKEVQGGEGGTKGKGKGKAAAEEGNEGGHDEVKDIEELIPELEDKIADLSTLPSALLTDASQGGFLADARKQLAAAPVNDVSGLVKKRKVGEAEGEVGNGKKMRADEA
ncbi:hypothetical protein M427DRAFT_57987 [Gonapodya prolifera JEL478]|uniref:Tetratricopeptide SHNi-TPR domain-containing protein n=1 Tax=Gonapodya prolifera (strain JEL478) TaxID=1344416 RepID=A0A139AB99_GONPJ|nr:hypothetical protein M427DRAFT_57987 [Gonapodya prolifera JEL478]|eukprot:KXS13988.1 hypothetical protein M427DRAFT_57987 [Gonapodya prolifera JEL478]